MCRPTIHKYMLSPTDMQEVRMPKGAKILCVQTQRDVPCIWAEVDVHQPMETRVFTTIGTGHTFPPGVLGYVGTYQIHNGRLVFHVYENGRE